MKKVILLMIVCTIAVLGVYTSQKSDYSDVSNLAIQNIEALAFTESGGNGCFYESNKFESCNEDNNYSHCPCGSDDW